MPDIPTSSFLAGAWVGLAVAAPIGPMGVLCIQRTLAHGIVAGLGTGLAAATVQVSYGTMALLGMGPAMLAASGASANVLSAASGAVLLWFAFRTAQGTPAKSTKVATFRPGLARSFRDALALGFSNPMTVALFFAASPALVGNSNASEVSDGRRRDLRRRDRLVCGLERRRMLRSRMAVGSQRGSYQVPVRRRPRRVRGLHVLTSPLDRAKRSPSVIAASFGSPLGTNHIPSGRPKANSRDAGPERARLSHR